MRRALLIVALAAMPSLAFAQQTPGQQRVDAAQRVATLLLAQYTAGMSTLEDLATWHKRLYEAKRDAGATGATLVAAGQQWADKMKGIEQLVQQRVRAGTANSVENDKALFYRLEAEMTLAKLKTPTSPGY